MNKLHVVLVSNAAPESFRFYDRLVYTSLLRCGSRTSSIRYISNRLGVAWKTVSDSRDQLIELGLATMVKSQLVAIKPDAERMAWFEQMKGEPLWWRSFKFIKFHAPSRTCPLDHRGLAVLGFLLYRANKKPEAFSLTYSYVGCKLGIDYRTASSVLLKLAERGFITHQRKTGRDVFSVPILNPVAVPAWFAVEDAKTTATDIAPNPNSVRIHTPTETNIDAHDQETRNDAHDTSRSTDEVCGRVVDDRPSRGLHFRRAYNPTGHEKRSLDDALSACGVSEDSRKLLVENLGCFELPSLTEYQKLIERSGGCPNLLMMKVAEFVRENVEQDRARAAE